MPKLRLIIEITYVTPEGALHGRRYKTVEVDIPDWVADTLSQTDYVMAQVSGAEVIEQEAQPPRRAVDEQ